MALSFSVGRHAATLQEVDAALARLDHAPGLYFGCDAGVAGLHPLQATLLAEPLLAIRIHEDGVEVEALDALGAALLRQPALAGFVAQARRGPGRSAVAAAREFLAAFGGCADALLVGALRFEAHRLGDRAPSAPIERSAAAAPLGVLYFGADLLRRNAEGLWHRVALRFTDPPLATLQVRERAPRSSRFAVPPSEPAASQPQPWAQPGSPAGPPADDDFPRGGYAAVVARAVERLGAGALVSLTLSQSFRRTVGAASVAGAFAALRRANPAPATFFVNTGAGERLFGASPDLQLVVRGREIEALPVCGTVARGHGPLGEAESFRQLVNEKVDAASLAVCTDALRNDLAPLCEPGSLRLLDRRRPMALATVVHAVDRLGGRLRAGADAWDAIVATAAPVMVTGTPRRLALAAIEALEAGPRGWYGGLVVEVGADGAARVGTILRAAAIRDGVAEVRTGGDLMADSDPEREEHESRIKAVSLWRALGMPVAGDLQAALADAAMPAVASAPPRADAAARWPAAVALRDAGDPFASAVAETLQALGLALDARAALEVRIGIDAATAAQRPAVADAGSGAAKPRDGFAQAAPAGGLVAIGDAAAQVLAEAGFTVSPIRPAHGRPVRCTPNPAIAGLPARAFTAMRYATLAVDWDPAGDLDDRLGWTVWAVDAHGRPLVLAHAGRRAVCLLLRPDSLLSEDLAREVLRAAIGFAATPAAPGPEK